MRAESIRGVGAQKVARRRDRLQPVGVVVAVRERCPRAHVRRHVAGVVVGEGPDGGRVSHNRLQLVVGGGVGVRVGHGRVGFARAITHAIEYLGLHIIQRANRCDQSIVFLVLAPCHYKKLSQLLLCKLLCRCSNIQSLSVLSLW